MSRGSAERGRLGGPGGAVAPVGGGGPAADGHDERGEPDEAHQRPYLDAYAPAPCPEIFTERHQDIRAAVHLDGGLGDHLVLHLVLALLGPQDRDRCARPCDHDGAAHAVVIRTLHRSHPVRSEEHTSELQSHVNLVCRLLLEKKKYIPNALHPIPSTTS